MLAITVFRNRHPFDQLHDKEGATVVPRSRIKHPRDIRVIHQSQRPGVRLRTLPEPESCPSLAESV